MTPIADDPESGARHVDLADRNVEVVGVSHLDIADINRLD